MLDGFFEQLRSDSLAAMSRVHQDHANPRKSAFVRDRRRRPAHAPFHFGDEASLRTRVKKSIPVCGRLIPSGELFQTEPRGDVLFGHRAKVHALKILGELQAAWEHT